VLNYTLDGRCLFKYAPSQDELGVKSLSWSPSSELIAIGSYDSKVRVISHLMGGDLSCVCAHPRNLNLSNTSIYVETENVIDVNRVGFQADRKYELFGESQFSLHPVPQQANELKYGINLVTWSHDSSLLATRAEETPNVMWIWDVKKSKLISLVIQLSPILCAVWAPTHHQLFFCTGNDKLYMWSPQSCSCVNLPSGQFKLSSLSWSSNGSSVLLTGHNEKFMCCYLNTINTVNEEQQQIQQLQQQQQQQQQLQQLQQNSKHTPSSPFQSEKENTPQIVNLAN